MPQAESLKVRCCASRSSALTYKPSEGFRRTASNLTGNPYLCLVEGVAAVVAVALVVVGVVEVVAVAIVVAAVVVVLMVVVGVAVEVAVGVELGVGVRVVG